MSIFDTIFDSLNGLFSDASEGGVNSLGSGYSDTVNPDTGLPLFGEGHGAIDIGGSPLGMDIHGGSGSGFE